MENNEYAFKLRTFAVTYLQVERGVWAWYSDNAAAVSWGPWRGKMGTGIDLFLDWENGIWVAGTGICPLGIGNEVLKNGNRIEVMWVDSQFWSVFGVFGHDFCC